MTDKPYSLDFFQDITNVHFAGVNEQYMASSRFYTDFDIPPTSDFGPYVSGATVRDLTVFSQGYVASGRIKIAPNTSRTVYLQAPWHPDSNYSSTPISLGQLNDRGNVSWSIVYGVPGRVTAISYANGRFFVTYTDGFTTFIAMTTNGRTFSLSTPWASGDGESGSSNVAYLKEADVYVTVGTKLVTEDVEIAATVIHEDGGCNDGYIETVFDINLAWATSRDGQSWTVGSSPNVYSGIGGGAGTGSAVAAGNGVFVTGAGKKNQFPALTPCCPPGLVIFTCCVGTFPFPDYGCNTLEAQRPDYVLNSAAVAVSTDGAHWTVVSLPEAQVESTDGGDTASNGTLVTFVRHDGVGKDLDGYFIAASWTHSSIDGGPIVGTIYRSDTGSDWSPVRSDANQMYMYLCAIAEDLALQTEK